MCPQGQGRPREIHLWLATQAKILKDKIFIRGKLNGHILGMEDVDDFDEASLKICQNLSGRKLSKVFSTRMCFKINCNRQESKTNKPRRINTPKVKKKKSFKILKYTVSKNKRFQIFRLSVREHATTTTGPSYSIHAH